MTNELDLARMTYVQVQAYFGKKNIALLPVGSTEQHGLHLPLGTDFLLATALAKDVASKTETLLLPTIPYGISKHHRRFPTVWITPQTFRDLVSQIVLSFKPHGLKKVVLVNGHGGNTMALGEVAEELLGEDIRCIVWEWWKTEPIEKLLREKAGPELGTITHADLGETSMALAHFEDSIQMDQAKDHPLTNWAPRVHGAVVHFSTHEFTEIGSLGAPTRASRELGEELRVIALRELELALRWLEKH
ncbi:MAG: creatininase family protein [Candidatus Hodarchaeota archaeon]